MTEWPSWGPGPPPFTSPHLTHPSIHPSNNLVCLIVVLHPPSSDEFNINFTGTFMKQDDYRPGMMLTSVTGKEKKVCCAGRTNLTCDHVIMSSSP